MKFTLKAAEVEKDLRERIPLISEYCCTCQSWHGIRTYEPRRGKVKYDNRAPDTPCNMNYRKPGACPKGNCRGYVR